MEIGGYEEMRYSANDRMSDLVSHNYRILLVMSRFGISLGVGDKTIGEVCSENGVDTTTFLAITDLLLGDRSASSSYVGSISVESMLKYLHNSHDYFLGFRLPGIRRDLVDVLGKHKDDLTRAVIDYFDEYVSEVRKHMMYEEKTVFPYVRSLLEGNYEGKYNIGIFSRHHDQVEARLTEFKNILIKYYPAKGSNELNSVLFDIFNCERDLASHNEIEDKLFTPAIELMEQKIAGKK